MIVIFSRDRAFQLEACLRTLLRHCEDAPAIPIRVLWTASTPRHRQSYDLLRASLESAGPADLQFIDESDFRLDLLLLLGRISPGSWKARAVSALSSLTKKSWGRAFAPGLIRLLVRPGVVLFVVDDTLFLRPFRFRPCSDHLLQSARRIAFSLRLGQDVTRSYMGDCAQQVPAMEPVDPGRGIYQFRWPDGEIDFEYPLEISSSLLNLRLIFTRLLRKPWKSPNTLELALAKMAGRYKRDHPLLLTFARPRAVSAPLNLVQQDFVANRHGNRDRYHPDRLCALFLRGIRADLSRLDSLEPNSVHLEIDLLPDHPPDE